MSVKTSKAYQNIEQLLDDNSFVEIGGLVSARSTDFNLNSKKAEGDGVVAGYGVINNTLVYVYSFDSDILGGSIGEMNASKIVNIYDLALKVGAPVIGLLDSSGIRLEEASDALDGLGRILKAQASASGIIPQIAAVLGNCGGGMAVSANMADFIYMNQNARLFIQSPDCIEGNNKDKQDSASAEFNSCNNLKLDYVGSNEQIYEQIRNLIQIIPENNFIGGVYGECSDDINRASDIEGCADNPLEILSRISDNGFVVQTKKDYTSNMLTAFIKLNGVTVGAVCNNEDFVTSRGLEKASLFVRFCDCYNIPLLTISNATKFNASIEDEKCLGRSAATLISSFVGSTVPRVNLITNKSYGTPYVLMNSKALDCDITYAWANSSIGTMEPELAAKIITQDSSETDEVCKSYTQIQSNIVSAANHGYVDTIINPIDTRKYLIGAYEMLMTKSVAPINRKNDTI